MESKFDGSFGSRVYRKHWYIRRSSSTPSDPRKVSHSNDFSSSRDSTVDPRITNDCCSLWQTQFGYLSLHSLILQCNLLDQQDFLPFARTMDIWSQSYIALNPLLRQVDYGFVKFILAFCYFVVQVEYSTHAYVQFNSQYCVDSSKQKSFYRCVAVCLHYAQRQGTAPNDLSPAPQA